MTIIKIVNEPEEIDQIIHSPIASFAILGINPFFNPLHLSLQDAKQFTIFLEGQPSHFITNVLWNQYFNNTLLKQCYHIITESCNSEHSFFKINGKTYRLFECLKWNNHQKLKADIEKCRSFYLQGFLSDGKIRTISFYLGKHSNQDQYDVIFQYVGKKEQKKCKSKRKSSFSQSLTSTGRKRTMSAVKLNIKASHMKSKELHSSQTEKKGKVPKQKNKMKENSNLKSIKISRNLKNQFTNNFDSSFCLKKDEIDIPISIQKTKKKGHFDKKEIVTKIIRQKSSTLKNYKKMLIEQDNKYENRMYEQEQEHKLEIEGIRIQIEEILNKYRSKAKENERQNECLRDQNLKLMNRVEKVEKKIIEVDNQLSYWKYKAEENESEKEKYQMEVQHLKKEVLKIKSQFEMEKQNLSMQLSQKEERKYFYKSKYESMMQNMKRLVDVEANCLAQFSSKENMF